MSGFSVECVQEAAPLRQHLGQWDALAAGAVEANPFYESWSLLPALEARPPAGGFSCALVWRDDEKTGRTLAGLFPLQRRRRYKGLPLEVLTSWRHDSWLLCTPLVLAGSATQAIRAFLAWAAGNRQGAGAVELRWLPCDGAFIGCLADALRLEPRMLASHVSTRAMLRRAPSAEACLEASLSKGWRKQLRRRAKRLQERGRVEHVALRRDEDAGPWIDDLFAIEAKGWKGQRGGALACSPERRRYAAAMLAGAHARGRLHMVGINLDGRPIARACNLLCGEGSYAYRTAYDEDFAAFSPGILAEIDNIVDFHALPGTQWLDSMSDPDNDALNRLWQHRRALQHLVIGTRRWGEIWVSLLPLLRWTRRIGRRPSGALDAKALAD